MRVLVVGAPRLGRLLARELLHAGHEVRILEPSEERLARLPAGLAAATVHGSPMERDALSGALAGCDAIAAVTDDDTVNAVVALAARRELRVPLAAAVIGNTARAEALSGLGAHIICPTARTARDLHLTLVRSGIEGELLFGGELGVYRAEMPVRLAGRTMRNLERPGELLPIAVERGGRALLAVPQLVVAEGDVLHVAALRRDDVADLVRP
jgi:trk system potassium uptake protein TrkA